MVTFVSASPSFDASWSGMMISTFSVALNKRYSRGAGGSTFRGDLFDLWKTET